MTNVDGNANPVLRKTEVLRNLETCYDRLAAIVRDENADPQLITDLTAEAGRLIDLLNRDKSLVPAAQKVEELQLLERLKSKVEEVESLFHKEMDRIKQNLGGLKRGKKAVNAYKPPAVGMGYSEGKFVDRKE